MKATFIVLFAFSFFLEPLYAQIKPDTVRIILKTIPGMQYDQVRFSVKPGSHIRLVLLNTDEMEHNLVLGQKDSRQKIVDAGLALGKDGPSVGYIPKITEVLNYIPLLKSGESDSILFRAPRVTGVSQVMGVSCMVACMSPMASCRSSLPTSVCRNIEE